MKKIYVLPLFLLIMMTLLNACKENVKTEEKPAEKTYAVMADSTSINWTAYKTTAKVPVKGQFSKITIENEKKRLHSFRRLKRIKI